MDTLEQLVADFQLHEKSDARGPRFVKLLLCIEATMRTNAVSREQLLSWLGPPDFFDGVGPDGDFVYLFDHHEAGHNRDEWYLHLRKGRLFRSGYNRTGINDLSKLKPRSDFSSQYDEPQKDFPCGTLFRKYPIAHHHRTKS